MIYYDYGLGYGFGGDYLDYYGFGVDIELFVYFMLVNDMLYIIYFSVIIIVEVYIFFLFSFYLM